VFDGLQWNSRRGLGRYGAQLVKHIQQFGWQRMSCPWPRWSSSTGRVLLSEIAEPIWRGFLRPDISVYPHNVVPMLCPASWGHNVLVLHDLLFLSPNNNRTVGNLYRTAKLQHSLSAANVVITVSRTSHDAIRELLNGRKPLFVIPNTLADAFSNLPPNNHHTSTGAFKILHFGGSAPSKNSREVIGSIRILKSQGHRVQLLLAAMMHEKKLVHQWLREEHLTDKDVTILPRLTDEELMRLYLTADAHCMPSTGEGFGIPVIEAARCEVPNILSALPVFVELMGEDAIYLKGWSASDIAAAILTCLDSDNSMMISRARDRTDAFLFDVVHDRDAIPALTAIEAFGLPLRE
jgi:glycosyltransferase involved in cell wall biosynthesis